MTKSQRCGGTRRAVALFVLMAHFGAHASTQACDPALDEAIEKRRQASDKQIDTVDQDISNSGKRMLDCMVDFGDVVGNSISIGGQMIDLSGVIKSLNQEACRMTREASQGRLPKFPSLDSVGRGAGGQLPGRTAPVYTPPISPAPAFQSNSVQQQSQGVQNQPLSNSVPLSYGTMDNVYDALSSAMGGRR